jgi:glycine/D-amino acid oxidase-like deaminating enzyme
MNQQQDHTGSYYAATVGDVTDFAQLHGEQSVDVCVIGAGFTGISTALHLAERGYKVAVVEANKVGWGASGRNGGQMIGGIAGENNIAKHHGKDVDELFSELRWAGHDIIRQRVEQYGIQCELKSGYLDVAIKPRHMRDFEADHRRLEQANFPHEFRILSQDETRDTIGTKAYIGSLLNMGNGHLHPLKLCVGEARAAVSLGTTIYEQSPVLEIKHGSRPRVVTRNGSITADAVVLAGNAYHELEPKLRGIMFPVRSFIIATEPLAELTPKISQFATRISCCSIFACLRRNACCSVGASITLVTIKTSSDENCGIKCQSSTRSSQIRVLTMPGAARSAYPSAECHKWAGFRPTYFTARDTRGTAST